MQLLAYTTRNIITEGYYVHWLDICRKSIIWLACKVIYKWTGCIYSLLTGCLHIRRLLFGLQGYCLMKASCCSYVHSPVVAINQSELQMDTHNFYYGRRCLSRSEVPQKINRNGLLVNYGGAMGTCQRYAWV